MTAVENEKESILKPAPRVLIIFFSFSGQTARLLNQIVVGIKEQGVKVVLEKLRPLEPLRFPLGGILPALLMMLTTFLGFRIPIKELSANCDKDFDLIILAGPTWSYNPSGPVLSLLDRAGKKLFSGKQVLPVISCRGYWRLHWYRLRKRLWRCGAVVPNIVVFTHPVKEPWSSIGVFLKIAGKSPEKSKLIGRYYRRYGHSREQMDEAWRFGMQIGEAITRKRSLSDLAFQTPLSLSQRQNL